MRVPVHIARRAYRAAVKAKRILRSAGAGWVLRRTWEIWTTEGIRGLRARVPAPRPLPKAASPELDGGLLHEIVTEDCSDLTPDGPVFVMVHAFYVDLFPEIVEALSGLNFPYTLGVSVTSERERESVIALARQRLKHAALDVRIVENRGRDIAPLLVTFADQLRASAYVCHLHTKKSLYSGRPQDQWRAYLVHALVGSALHRGRVFQQFRARPEIGIIYPETFEAAAPWAHTWLENRTIANALAARMGVALPSGYMDFPIGSMFWARSAALRPLLDLQLQIVDFPVEAGQINGTLHHTLERFFTLSARHAGFELRVMDVEAGDATVFSNFGDKNLSAYYAQPMYDRIVGSVGNPALVSFDLFDTLLVRPLARPDGVVELINEQAWLRPRAEICRAARTLRARGHKLALVVDTQLTREAVRGLLQAHGLDIFDHVLLSSETGLRKDTGAAWRELPSRLQMARERWLHVGSDECADVQRPIDAGMRSPIHVMRMFDVFQHWNEGAWWPTEPMNWQQSYLLGTLARRFAGAIDRDGAQRSDFGGRVSLLSDLKDVGYCVLGPLLSCFMAWLFDRADRAGASQLLYAGESSKVLSRLHAHLTSHAQLAATPRAATFPHGVHLPETALDASSVLEAVRPGLSAALVEFGPSTLQRDLSSRLPQLCGAYRMLATDAPEQSSDQDALHGALLGARSRELRTVLHALLSAPLPDAEQVYAGVLAFVDEAVAQLGERFFELYAGADVVTLPVEQFIARRWRLPGLDRNITARSPRPA